MITIIDVLKKFYPNTEWGCDESTYEGLHWADKTRAKPTESEIQAKIAELQSAEPLRLLRIERNRLLQETDWWAGQDLTMTQKQKDYRQALRDLPSTASPKIENDVLTNVTWPTKPE